MVIKNLLSKEEIKKLNDFWNVSEFQRDFYKNTNENDNSFNNLKEEEEKQLKEEFQKIKGENNYLKNIKDKFKIN
jgi:sulfur relay (sulfurtransferase) DsrC/TusE family protein